MLWNKYISSCKLSKMRFWNFFPILLYRFTWFFSRKDVYILIKKGLNKYSIFINWISSLLNNLLWFVGFQVLFRLYLLGFVSDTGCETEQNLWTTSVFLIFLIVLQISRVSHMHWWVKVPLSLTLIFNFVLLRISQWIASLFGVFTFWTRIEVLYAFFFLLFHYKNVSIYILRFAVLSWVLFLLLQFLSLFLSAFCSFWSPFYVDLFLMAIFSLYYQYMPWFIHISGIEQVSFVLFLNATFFFRLIFFCNIYKCLQFFSYSIFSFRVTFKSLLPFPWLHWDFILHFQVLFNSILVSFKIFCVQVRIIIVLLDESFLLFHVMKLCFNSFFEPINNFFLKFPISSVKLGIGYFASWKHMKSINIYFLQH